MIAGLCAMTATSAVALLQVPDLCRGNSGVWTEGGAVPPTISCHGPCADLSTCQSKLAFNPGDGCEYVACHCGNNETNRDLCALKLRLCPGDTAWTASCTKNPECDLPRCCLVERVENIPGTTQKAWSWGCVCTNLDCP